MKGYTYRPDDRDQTMSLPLWEALVTDAVGEVIEFWGFKRNHGRVWALLYVRNEAMTARQIQEGLDLSKGAVSMITRDLEDWEVVRRTRRPGSSARHFVAESDFMQMITRVLQRREGKLIARVATDLKDARKLAEEAGEVDPEVLERIERMQKLAGLMKQALQLFTRTARLDVRDTRDVL